MGGPWFDLETGRFSCVMAWRFPVSEKKHILDGVPELIVAEFAPLFGAIGRNKNAMAQDARDRICQVVARAEDQFGAIHALLDRCAAEVHGFKLLDAGTATDRQVANLVGYLRSEMEAEKLNTAGMVSISNERDRLTEIVQQILGLCESGAGANEAALVVESLVKDRRDLQARCESLRRQTPADQAWRAELEHYRSLAIGVCSRLGMTREEIAGDVLHSAVDRIRELQERAKLDDEKAALVELAQFAGVRSIGVLMPIDLIKLSTAALKSVMTAHDEDTRKIQELQRRIADMPEVAQANGAALNALPDTVKEALGNVPCPAECIRRLGRMAEDMLTHEARERGQHETIKALQGDAGRLRQQLNDAQRRADYGRRLYEAERDHCARITAVLNDAQILTDPNELPF